jgi:putative tryptophan/tyrosine transport system substrate-binding protein
MRRREFIAGLGSAAAWPLAARAQRPERVRRICVLMPGDNENDPVFKPRLSAFTQALAELGWTDGRNVRMDVRWYGNDNTLARALAQELVGLQPDIIVTSTTPATVAVQRETRTIPIVFGNVADPIASGIVARLDRPNGNITGFGSFEASLRGKWLEVLSEIAPALKRAAIIFRPETGRILFHPDAAASILLPFETAALLPSETAYFLHFETTARSLKIVPILAPVHDDVEIETAIIALGREQGGGLVVPAGAFTTAHRASIILAAARNNVPAVYSQSFYVRDGGLVSYGLDLVDNFRRTAAYVDRILRGAKPAELPVQLPTKYEMAVNLKTAKALGRTVPQSILLRADEVIE